MVATQRLVMSSLSNATVPGQSEESTDRNVARATRLMQLFCVQTEILAKMTGNKGVQQRVVVEHVTVASGGSAIVGAVSTRGRASFDDER